MFVVVAEARSPNRWLGSGAMTRCHATTHEIAYREATTARQTAAVGSGAAVEGSRRRRRLDSLPGKAAKNAERKPMRTSGDEYEYKGEGDDREDSSAAGRRSGLVAPGLFFNNTFLNLLSVVSRPYFIKTCVPSLARSHFSCFFLLRYLILNYLLSPQVLLLGLDACDEVFNPGSMPGGGARPFPFPTKEALARVIEGAGGFPPVITRAPSKLRGRVYPVAVQVHWHPISLTGRRVIASGDGRARRTFLPQIQSAERRVRQRP
jgi:hypothetical protein